MSDYGLGLAKSLVGHADRDTRSLREKLRDLERGDSVRIVTESRDVLARVETDSEVSEDVDATKGVAVEASVKVYGDNQYDHETTSISWWQPGPVLIGIDERVNRLEFK